MFVNLEFIKGILEMEISAVKVLLIILIIGFSKGNGRMDFYLGMEYSLGLMEIDTKVNI